MTPHQIFQSGIVSDDGLNLTFQANEHLFLWPGALVYGELEAMASDEPDTVSEEMDVKDWGRRAWLRSVDGVGYPDIDRLRPPAPAPEQDVRDLRRQYMPERDWQKQPPSPRDPQFARPNMAAAFEARADRDRFLSINQDYKNPVLEKTEVTTLAADFPTTDRDPSPTFYSGAQWILDAVAEEILGVKSLIPPLLLETLGPAPCGNILANYLRANDDPARVRGILKLLDEQILQRAEKTIELKLSRIESEIFLWADAGRLPVQKPGAGPDVALCLCNAATAVAGIYHLCNLAIGLQDFRSSARMAFGALLQRSLE